MARWYSYHHLDVTIDEEGGGMAINIPLVCQYLIYDTGSGMAYCKIYETRPQICREYICESANGED